MKRNILILLSLSLVILFCEKEADPKVVDPSLTINKSEITFTDVVTEEAISFVSNVSWTVKSTQSCRAFFLQSGEASTKILLFFSLPMTP